MPTRSYGTSSFRSSPEGSDDGVHEDSQVTPRRPAAAKRSRYGRQTVQWPFQSITTIETAISSQLLSHSFTPMPLPIPRRSTSRPMTWAPKRMLPLLHRRSASTLDTNLVPDYVINYIRGETPETVARRKMNDGKLGERGVDVVTGHQVHKSRTALFGYLNDRSSTLRPDGYGDERSSSSTMQRNHGGEWQDLEDGDADDSRILLGDESGRERSKGVRRRAVMVGWRMGVAMNLLLTSLTCVVAIVGFSLAISRDPGGSWDGTVIYTGACSTADHINLGLHAVVSIFAIVLLAGANYAFQVLSSPTRAEVDAAHASGRWLGIGIPSVGNLFHIGKTRGLVATGLVLVILALQILYHAALYTSHTVADVNLCGVSVNPSLLGTATLLNLILVMLLAWILFYAFKSSSQSLVSLGDAISSFLEHKDGYIQKSSNSNNWGVEKTAERRYCWFRIPSVPTWLLFVISWTVPTALAAAVFGRSLQSRQFTFSSFGSIDSSNYTNLNTPSTPLGTSIIAALPQLLLALLYLSTNYLLTTYYLCKEISLYSNQARSLRVTTSPQGSQTPSLYLTLPRPWSWFLVTFFTAMSFVLSQSVFSVAFDPVSIANMHSNGTGNTPRTVIGFSGTGLLILLVLLFVLFLVVIGQGFRPIEPLPGLPSIKTPTSRDISSCCHPDQGRWERREA